MDSIFNGIEFLKIENGNTGSRRPRLMKNEISLSSKDKNGIFRVLRFSPMLDEEIEEYDTAKIARNNFTGDIFIVLFKDGSGDVPLNIEGKSKGSSYTYKTIQRTGFIITLCRALNITNSGKRLTLKISDNLSNDQRYCTFKVSLNEPL